MDISTDANPPLPNGPQRNNREPSARASTKSDIAVSAPLETSSGESQPEHGGVLASAEVEQGLLRDAAAQRETKDRVPDTEADISTSSIMRESLDRLAKEARLPTNAALSIRVDKDSSEPTFLVFNKETKDIIREIPGPEIKELLRKMGQSESLFLDTTL